MWTVNLWVPSLPGGARPGFEPDRRSPFPAPSARLRAGLKHVYVVDVDGAGGSESSSPRRTRLRSPCTYRGPGTGWELEIQTNLPVQTNSCPTD